MGVYRLLRDIQPRNFKAGDTVTLEVSIFNNEGAKYVDVEI
jgi:uncharacterized protein YfaS (alpha-2-macroglobulin family)